MEGIATQNGVNRANKVAALGAVGKSSRRRSNAAADAAAAALLVVKRISAQRLEIGHRVRREDGVEAWTFFFFAVESFIIPSCLRRKSPLWQSQWLEPAMTRLFFFKQKSKSFMVVCDSIKNDCNRHSLRRGEIVVH